MTNYASLRGPVGMNRVYASSSPRTPALSASRKTGWLEALRAGRTMATNGPLLGLTVEGRPPGSEIQIIAHDKKLKYRGFMRSSRRSITSSGREWQSRPDLRWTGKQTSGDVHGTMT